MDDDGLATAPSAPDVKGLTVKGSASSDTGQPEVIGSGAVAA